MEEIIRLKSRHKAKNYLEKVIIDNNTKTKTYVLKTDLPNLRVGYLSKSSYTFIDPSGGPMIRVGCKLEEADAVVKSIDFIEGYGWTITFE